MQLKMQYNALKHFKLATLKKKNIELLFYILTHSDCKKNKKRS